VKIITLKELSGKEQRKWANWRKSREILPTPTPTPTPKDIFTPTPTLGDHYLNGFCIRLNIPLGILL